MRKDVVVGLGLAGLAAVAFGGYSYLNTRVLAEVEAAFAGLRANGVGATHGPVAVSLLSRRVEIAEVVLKPVGNDGDVTIGKLTIDGVDTSSIDFAANRVELTNLATGNLGGMTPGGRTSLKVPSLIATGVRTSRSAPANDAASHDSVQRIMQFYSTLSAATVTAPVLAVTATMTMPVATAKPATQSTTFDTSTTYTNLKLEGLRDGRIARASFEKATIAPDKGTMPFTGTIDGAVIADIDMMPIFGIGLTSRTPRDGYYPIQGKMTTGAYTIKMADGAEVTVGGFSASGMDVDPTKLSYGRLRDMMATFASVPPQPTPAQQQAIMSAVVNIYEGIRFDDISVRDMSITGPKAAPQTFTMAMGGMTMSRFSGGKLGEFRIDKVSGTAGSPGGVSFPIKLGGFALQGFDLVKVMKFGLEAAAAAGKTPPPEKVYGLLSSLDGFELTDIAAPDPRTGQMVQIDRLKASWGQFVGDLPTRLRLSFKGATPLNPSDPNTALLRQNGMRSVALTMDTTTDWDAASRLATGTTALDLDQLGGLSANISLGNVPRSAFSVRPGQLNAILPDIEIGPLQLKLQDKGMMKLVRGALGGDPQADPLASLKQALIDPAKPASNLATLLDGASRFLAKPGQTLTLKLVPKARVAVGQFTAPGAMQAPDALVNALEAFTMDVAVAP